MNYVEQWTHVPELPTKQKEVKFYTYTLIDPMTEGTVGAGMTGVYYKKEALDTLKRNMLIGTPTSSVAYSYKYEFQNSLAKPSLPYYPLSV